MASAEVDRDGIPSLDLNGSSRVAPSSTWDLQRLCQLLLATIWLLDAVLQLQPFMFTRGPDGFSGMLNGVAAGSPGWVARTITWNGSVVYHQPILTNAAFASIQFLIAFGIVYRRTTAYALGLSIAWSLGVWWFGEGFGGVFVGAATPFGGGPGGVLFYALLAVFLWPGGASDRPFVAARTIGVRAATVVWVVWWAGLSLLALVGSGRSPNALHDLVAGLSGGEPGWLADLDRASEAFLLHYGSAAAVLLALVCAVAAVGIFLPIRARRATLVLAAASFAVIWVAVQDFGGILVPGATDPNSGPLILLLLFAFWPLPDPEAAPTGVGRRPVSGQM